MATAHRTHRPMARAMLGRVLFVGFCIIVLTFGADAAGMERHRRHHHGRHHKHKQQDEEPAAEASPPNPEEASVSPDAISYYSSNGPLEVRFTEELKSEDAAYADPTVPSETATESSQVEVQSEVETPQPPDESESPSPVVLEEEAAAASAASPPVPAVSQDPAPSSPVALDPLVIDRSFSTDDDDDDDYASSSDSTRTELSELSASEEGIGSIRADPNSISMTTIAFGIIIASAFIFGCISFAVYHRYTKDNYSTYERHVARTFDPDI